MNDRKYAFVQLIAQLGTALSDARPALPLRVGKIRWKTQLRYYLLVERAIRYPSVNSAVAWRRAFCAAGGNKPRFKLPKEGLYAKELVSQIDEVVYVNS